MQNIPVDIDHTYEAKKAMKMTFGLAKIDCHIVFFAS